MAEDNGDREIPEIRGAVGFKTTTVRLTQEMFDEVELFAKARNQNTTDFIKDALEYHIGRLAKNPGVQKALQKTIARQQAQLDRIMTRVQARNE